MIPERVQLSKLVHLASDSFGCFFLRLENLNWFIMIVSYALSTTYGIQEG